MIHAHTTLAAVHEPRLQLPGDCQAPASGCLKAPGCVLGPGRRVCIPLGSYPRAARPLLLADKR